MLRDSKFTYHSDGMNSLYLCNVPDEVIKRLRSLAEREGMSVSAMATTLSAAVPAGRGRRRAISSGRPVQWLLAPGRAPCPRRL